jgi:hypothetical protein
MYVFTHQSEMEPSRLATQTASSSSRTAHSQPLASAPHPLLITGQALQRLRSLLTQALRAARSYNGSRRSEQTLFTSLSRLEQCLSREHRECNLSRDEAEGVLLRQAYRSYALERQAPLSISELLELAVESLRSKLLRRTVRVPTIEVPLCLVPPRHDGSNLVRGGGGLELPRFDDSRETEILVLLIRNRLSIDEIRIYAGAVPSNSLRVSPYRLIQIPRLNREILVCNQIGECTYVGRGLKGPLFWATYDKKFFQQHPEVTAVVAAGNWMERLAQVLFTDNPLQKRKRCQVPSKRRAASFPLTEDMIIVNALRSAAQNSWRLPTAHDGEIPWLPGQSWDKWDGNIRAASCGLERNNCTGLSHLLNIYGCKHGSRVNTEVVQHAWMRLQAGEPHGLTDAALTRTALTEDFIIRKALEWASTHDWTLPTRASDEIPGVLHDTWRTWSSAIRHRRRGLTRSQCRGLAHLYQLHGLRSVQRDRREVIRAAWQRIERGEEVGLLVAPPAQPLTEDLIIRHVIAYAAAHSWQLPTGKQEAVAGLSGEVWVGWCWALRLRRRGLTREGCKGLSHLIRIYGLKTGRLVNTAALQAAWARIQKGEPHGLRPLDHNDTALTEAEVLRKGREWSEAHEGRLPQTDSGLVPGLAVTWMEWECTLRLGGGQLRQPYSNLAHAFRIIGLRSTVQSHRRAAAARAKHLSEPSQDLVLAKALEWSSMHQWQLPVASSGQVPGMLGTTWRQWESIVRRRMCETLATRVAKRHPALRTLFRDYGLLKTGVDCTSSVQVAWARLQRGEPHGLVAGQYALTEDLILRKAIEWAARHQWRLPLETDTAVEESRDDDWRAYHYALRGPYRGLTRTDCKGLTHLYRIYGLRRERADDKALLQEAWKNLQEGRSHGLTDQHAGSGLLTEELILTKAVERAASHDWQLPIPSSEAVPGLVGESWLTFDRAVRQSRRGLTRKHCTGLRALYRIYGLKRGYRTHVPLLKQTWDSLQQGKPLGLIDTHGDQQPLTEALIIGEAARWAIAHQWTLPRETNGAVPGHETQTWCAWSKAIKNCRRGLTRAGCRGLGHLYRIYGLRSGQRSVNKEKIQEVLTAFQNTKSKDSPSCTNIEAVVENVG